MEMNSRKRRQSETRCSGQEHTKKRSNENAWRGLQITLIISVRLLGA